MNKQGVATFVAIAVVVGGWLALQEHKEPPALAPTVDAVATAAVPAGSIDIIAPELDGGIAAPLVAPPADAGLIDTTTIPELSDAPESLSFGVILIQYEGAEGAPGNTRSREEAKSLALELLSAAQEDFKAAVKRGDPGSTAAAGHMFKGILEPAAEYALFSLAKNEVSEPVDTPRGYWIVKRLD